MRRIRSGRQGRLTRAKIRSAQGCGKAKFFSRSGFFEAASIFLKTAKGALIRAG
jgi:hypothetical protein